MPYLKSHLRDIFDPHIAELLAEIHQFVDGAESDDEAMADAGAYLNYIFNSLAYGVLMNVPEETRYRHLERLMGTFICAQLEFNRRVVAPFEDERCKENGDVYV